MSDGFIKNLEKFSSEYKRLRTEMAPHWSRMWKDKDSHSYVNLFVESRRSSPYLMGHIDAILYPILIITIIVTVLF